MPAASRNQQVRRRSKPPLVAASEELRSLIAAVEHEVSSWPQIRLKPMFGLTAIYRNQAIFGVLPKTRSMEIADSIWVKFPKPTAAIRKKLASEPRLLAPDNPAGAQWYTVSEITPQDYSFVIEWLAIAYKSTK